MTLHHTVDLVQESLKLKGAKTICSNLEKVLEISLQLSRALEAEKEKEDIYKAASSILQKEKKRESTVEKAQQ